MTGGAGDFPCSPKDAEAERRSYQQLQADGMDELVVLPLLTVQDVTAAVDIVRRTLAPTG